MQNQITNKFKASQKTITNANMKSDIDEDFKCPNFLKNTSWLKNTNTKVITDVCILQKDQ